LPNQQDRSLWAWADKRKNRTPHGFACDIHSRCGLRFRRLPSRGRSPSRFLSRKKARDTAVSRFAMPAPVSVTQIERYSFRLKSSRAEPRARSRE
jgi:hypothetical protein